MERTIDGIDYIAKSEVLRIIDERIALNARLGSSESYGGHGDDFHSACVLELGYLRDELSEYQER